MERIETGKPSAPLVEKVLYGVGKFIENQGPVAHQEKIIYLINRFIIPKLSPKQLEFVNKHKDAIETAAMVAGVGITTAEIVAATVFTVRAVKRFGYALNRLRTQHKRTSVPKVYEKGWAGPVFFRTSDAKTLSFLAAEMDADPRWPREWHPVKPDEQLFSMLTDPGRAIERDINDAFQKWQKGYKQTEKARQALKGKRLGKKLSAISADTTDRISDIRNRIRKLPSAVAARQKGAMHNKLVRTGSAIDSSLALRNPELVAAIAGKAKTLGTSETTLVKELATLLVGVRENPKRYRSFLDRLNNASTYHEALVAASDLIEKAHNSQQGVAKIEGIFSTKFSTLASFWLDRLGKVGWEILQKK